MYHLLKDGDEILALVRDADNATIPWDLNNTDFKKYLKDVEEGRCKNCDFPEDFIYDTSV